MILVNILTLSLLVDQIGMTVFEIGMIDRPYSYIPCVKTVFHGACFGAVSAPTLYAPYPRKALPGEDKARTKSAPKPLQNTLHGKRALESGMKVANSFLGRGTLVNSFPC